MGTLSEWWSKWAEFVEAAKADPKAAVSQLVTDNLQIVIPIAALIIGIIVIRLMRRGD